MAMATAAADPTVPGAYGERPHPNHVAIWVAAKFATLTGMRHQENYRQDHRRCRAAALRASRVVAETGTSAAEESRLKAGCSQDWLPHTACHSASSSISGGSGSPATGMRYSSAA